MPGSRGEIHANRDAGLGLGHLRWPLSLRAWLVPAWGLLPSLFSLPCCLAMAIQRPRQTPSFFFYD